MQKISVVEMLGYDRPLKWKYVSNGGIQILIPEDLQVQKNRPCNFAWTFKIE